MSTNSETDARAELVKIFRNRERRHRMASEFRKIGLAAQIREMRVGRGWTQAQVAAESGKVQETISQVENPDYGRYTITTLDRLADAFDVPLFVRFGTWGELADRIAGLSPEDLAVPDFDHDPGLHPVQHEAVATDSVVARPFTGSSNELRPFGESAGASGGISVADLPNSDPPDTVRFLHNYSGRGGDVDVAVAR